MLTGLKKKKYVNSQFSCGLLNPEDEFLKMEAPRGDLSLLWAARGILGAFENPVVLWPLSNFMNPSLNRQVN